MAMPNVQPTLPPEGVYSDAELLFIAEQPKKLFPENQNSNWGLLRRILTEQPQAATDLLSELVIQMYVDTTNDYMGSWEWQMGLPVAPAGLTLEQRRVRVQNRRTIDLFSVARIKAVVESFLTSGTGGIPTDLTPAGVIIGASGFTLYSGAGSVTTQYRIYFSPTTYSYSVWIASETTPDLVALTRELAFITPAGMSFTIDNTHSGATIIDYGKTVLNKGPSAFYRLADYTDSSGYANNGTAFGTISALASPGLLVAGKNDDQAGKTFDGSTGYFTAPDANQLDLNDMFTIEFWIRQVSATGIQTVVDKGQTHGFKVVVNAGIPRLLKSNDQLICPATQTLTAGTIYHCVVRKAGEGTVSWRINTLNKTGAITPAACVDNTGSLHVGRTYTGGSFLNAALDELAIYPRWLSDAEIVSNYQAGKLINP